MYSALMKQITREYAELTSIAIPLTTDQVLNAVTWWVKKNYTDKAIKDFSISLDGYTLKLTVTMEGGEVKEDSIDLPVIPENVTVFSEISSLNADSNGIEIDGSINIDGNTVPTSVDLPLVGGNNINIDVNERGDKFEVSTDTHIRKIYYYKTDKIALPGHIKIYDEETNEIITGRRLIDDYKNGIIKFRGYQLYRPLVEPSLDSDGSISFYTINEDGDYIVLDITISPILEEPVTGDSSTIKTFQRKLSDSADIVLEENSLPHKASTLHLSEEVKNKIDNSVQKVGQSVLGEVVLYGNFNTEEKLINPVGFNYENTQLRTIQMKPRPVLYIHNMQSSINNEESVTLISAEQFEYESMDYLHNNQTPFFGVYVTSGAVERIIGESERGFIVCGESNGEAYISFKPFEIAVDNVSEL